MIDRKEAGEQHGRELEEKKVALAATAKKELEDLQATATALRQELEETKAASAAAAKTESDRLKALGKHHEKAGYQCLRELETIRRVFELEPLPRHPDGRSFWFINVIWGGHNITDQQVLESLYKLANDGDTIQVDNYLFLCDPTPGFSKVAKFVYTRNGSDICAWSFKEGRECNFGSLSVQDLGMEYSAYFESEFDLTS